ncbi:RNA-binding S4 domain-containing protein [Shewanella marina]|uniref:RNA-binding S4 domain-containing protein n=1 Tax=Shewanella marina TaxID=487319 RepID=UPI00046EAB25
MSAQAELLVLRSGEEYIELYKLLKVQGLMSAGGEAKHVISEGMVKVNGQVETRKRNKIVAGDLVEFNGELVKVVQE